MVLDQTMYKLSLFSKQSCLGFSGVNKNEPRLLHHSIFALNILNDGDTIRPRLLWDMQRLSPVESQPLWSAFSGRQERQLYIYIFQNKWDTCMEKGKNVTYKDIVWLSFVINIWFSERKRDNDISETQPEGKIMMILSYSGILEASFLVRGLI